MNDDKSIFIEVIRADSSLPHAIRDHASAVEGFERRVFDQSYLDFLREQIAIEPRGPEWTAVLTSRLIAIAPYCDVPTLSGIIHVPNALCFVRVDPDSRRVIHYEEHESTGIA